MSIRHRLRHILLRRPATALTIRIAGEVTLQEAADLQGAADHPEAALREAAGAAEDTLTAVTMNTSDFAVIYGYRHESQTHSYNMYIEYGSDGSSFSAVRIFIS